MLTRLLVLFALFLATAAAAQETPVFESAAARAVLIDARSGAVFYEKNADELMPPASMSKLMTMILVFEALKAGTVTMEQEFVISENAWRKGGAVSGGSTMYAELKSRVKLKDLVQGVVIQSANDACIAIAEGMAGSEEEFARRMTARARELGLRSSVFRNATGLPDPEHLMTVRELSMLARYIIETFPEYYPYYSQPSFTWNEIKQDNRNPLLKDYPGADGMKTGYTRESGYGLVGSAQRDGRRLVAVIAGLDTAGRRKDEARKLLDWGFSQFKSIDVYAAGERVGAARVWGGAARWVDLRTPAPVRVMLSPAEQESAEAVLSYNGPLIAPVKAGEKIGTLRFVSQGAVLSEYPLETAAAVAASESIWGKAVDSILIMVLGG